MSYTTYMYIYCLTDNKIKQILKKWWKFLSYILKILIFKDLVETDSVEISDIGNGVKLQIGANLGAVISALRNTYVYTYVKRTVGSSTTVLSCVITLCHAGLI